MITRGVAAGVLVCATLEVATGQVVLPGPPRSDARMTVIGRSCVPDSGWGGMAFKIIDKLIAELPIDSTRIYVTGHSMGGAGTWHTIA